MGILDRYVLRQFCQNFVVCFCSLTGLYLIYDAFSNLDEFSRYASGWNLARTMSEYYAYRAVFFFDRTCGIVALMSAMFTVAWLRRHHELTAIMAAGISGGRVVAPVIVACMVLSLAASTSRELLIPRLRNQLNREPRDLQGDLGQPLRPRYDNQTDVLLRGHQTFAKDQRISAPNFGLPGRFEHLGKQLVAENAFYRPAQQGRPAGYLLVGVQHPENLATLPPAVLDGRQVVLTPLATRWLAPSECFVVSDVSFEQLVGGRNWRLFSSTRELLAGLRNPSLDFGADVRVAIHYRLVQPLLDATLFLLGLPLVLGREQRNIFVAVGASVGLVLSFVMLLLACQYLGANYLVSPAQAAWIPLAIFAPLAAALADRFRA